MKKILFVFGCSLLLLSCKHEPLPFDGPIQLAPGDNSVSFQDEIQPLLIANCAQAGCHDAASRQDGVQLTEYKLVVREVRPGNPGESDLYEAITEDDADKIMPRPPRAPLNSNQIALIRRWIEEGARNTVRSQGACDTTVVTYAVTIRPILDQYCVGCHNGSFAEAGLNLQQYNQIQNKQAAIYDRISRSKQDPLYMPRGGNMPDCQTQKIKAWIHQGAAQN